MSLAWGAWRALWALDRAATWQRRAEADERRYNQRRRKGDVAYGRRRDDVPTQLRPIHNSYAVHLFWIVVLCAVVFLLAWNLGWNITHLR
jgi:hypothetical protein